jgi:hypothetical protein
VVERPYVGLLRALDAAHVGFAIAGGVAVVLHGVPRMTFDLDIVVDLGDDNMRLLVATLGGLGFVPRLPVPLAQLADADARKVWTTERNLIAFAVHRPARIMDEVDVLLVTPFPWSEIAQSIVWRDIDGIKVPLVGRHMLRRMKLLSGRAKDLADAELLGAIDD